jgi:antitoxin component YwqK of YwqJK toxin-antitoxin module
MKFHLLLLLIFPFCSISQHSCDNVPEGFSGKYKLYYEGGQVNTIQHFKKGMPHGKILAYYETGEIKVKGVYKNGLVKEGTTLYTYYIDGSIEVENFASYELLIVREYHENGRLRTTGQISIEDPTRLNHRIGTWKTYDKEGKLIFETFPEKHLTRIISDE